MVANTSGRRRLVKAEAAKRWPKASLYKATPARRQYRTKFGSTFRKQNPRGAYTAPRRFQRVRPAKRHTRGTTPPTLSAPIGGVTAEIR